MPQGADIAGFGSNLITVDTVQIHPVGDALTKGSLSLSTVPLEALDDGRPVWSGSSLNSILVIAAVLIMILYLRRIVDLIPYLIRSAGQWRQAKDIEDNMRLTRDRDAIASVMIIPFCLVLSYMDIWHPSFMDDLGYGMRTAAVGGAFFVFILFRDILIAAVRPRGRDTDTYRLANRTIYNHFILLTILLSITCLITTAFNFNSLNVKALILSEMALSWLIFAIRKEQILSRPCGQFKAFLYLCGPEMLPVALLTAAEVIL